MTILLIYNGFLKDFLGKPSLASDSFSSSPMAACRSATTSEPSKAASSGTCLAELGAKRGYGTSFLKNCGELC